MNSGKMQQFWLSQEGIRESNRRVAVSLSWSVAVFLVGASLLALAGCGKSEPDNLAWPRRIVPVSTIGAGTDHPGLPDPYPIIPPAPPRPQDDASPDPSPHSTWPVVPQRKATLKELSNSIETDSSVVKATAQRKPIAAQRPHKVTLAFVEDRTTNSPRHSHGKRLVFDIDPPVAPGETVNVDCRIHVPHLKDGEGYGTYTWAFDDHGETVSWTGQNHGKLICEPPDFGFHDWSITAERVPVAGVEVWLIGQPQDSVNVDWVRLNGKTVYGSSK
jgi:hypothetical protein